jgi:hypothetical protein
MRPRAYWTTICTALVLAVAVYVNAAKFRYRFAHPEKTETQLFNDLPHWITWPNPP